MESYDYLYGWHLEGCEEFPAYGLDGETVMVTHTGSSLGDCPDGSQYIGLIREMDSELEVQRMDDNEANEIVNQWVSDRIDDDYDD